MLAMVPQVAPEMSSLIVERITDAAAFAELHQEWDELLQASDSPCIFLSWEWLFIWWKHLADDRTLCILTVRRENQLVALAPFGLHARSLSGARPFATLEFLGSGFAGSDYLDVIVRKGSHEGACDALTSHLAHNQVPLKWTNLKKGENIASAVIDGLTRKGWRAARRTTNVCPFIPLEGASWESYLASLSAEHRYNFNRKWRRLNRDYAVQFEEARSEQQRCEALDILIAQHNTRWDGRGGSSAFHTTGLIAFHEEWSDMALRRGWLRLYVLRVDGKPAACLYGFLYGGRFYFYQSSFDASFTQNSVGLIIMGLAIQSAISEGAQEYDLLHGDEAYKSHWSHKSRDLERLEAFPPGVRGMFFRFSVEVVRASRAVGCRLMTGKQPI